tara:strand:+ start:166 stop:345 length:180 start_codon:yes stop_codon:yes gene_type:complete
VEREEDEVYLRNMLLADHENIRRVHESERNLVVNMLVKWYVDLDYGPFLLWSIIFVPLM